MYGKRFEEKNEDYYVVHYMNDGRNWLAAAIGVAFFVCIKIFFG